MANKEVLDQLAAERLTRATDLQALGHAATTLETVVASWQREAALLARSQRKGWQGEAKTLGAATALLKLELIELAKLANRTPPRAPVPLGSMPAALPNGTASLDRFANDMQAEGRGELIEGDAQCPGITSHDAHTWIGAANKCYRCSGSTSLSMQLAREISDAILDDFREPRDTVPITITLPTVASVADFLSGAVDELPALHPVGIPRDDLRPVGNAWPNAYSDGGSMPEFSAFLPPAVERLGTQLFTESTVHQEIDATMPDVHADPLSTIPMFTEADAPRPYTRPVPPAGAGLKPYTWADLAAPAKPDTIPEHMSPSQLSTLDTCAAQARISRYDGNPGIPLWAGVGGTAFHKAVEELELGIMVGTTHLVEIQSWTDWIDRLWSKAFHAAITAELAESGVPMADWHASNRGKENYSWWLVEGGEMLKRYVDYRVMADDGRKVLVLPDGRPAIELELNLTVFTGPVDLPVKVILDIVWQLPDGSLEIWDHKTKGWSMDDPDTIQLGTQGHALLDVLIHQGLDAPTGLTARYFDARKGVPTEAFDPLGRHPAEELEMRYADADDKRRNRPAIPVRSNLCKACPVAYLCPVGSKL
jgi:PD-(D/E)XK nuclease superfamily